MTDRTTKALLLAIAGGLWMNVASQWLRPVVVQAQDEHIAAIASDVDSLERVVGRIAGGTCTNSKIC